ncbi:2-dehydro-3-deoxyphosphooctonate aldolase [Salmonella sp. NCTC 11881]|nr:2-dehydro-3-deoxyphosphooctonate aldolase [Salmonella sp. NCTC 11881]
MKQKVVNIGDIKVANDLPFVLFGGMKRAGVTRSGNAHL